MVRALRIEQNLEADVAREVEHLHRSVLLQVALVVRSVELRVTNRPHFDSHLSS